MMAQIREYTSQVHDPLAGESVSCEEFQARLPQLLGEDVRSHEHLKTCPRCSALLEELEYIAGIASDLLLPVYEPRDSVWEKINASLPPQPAESSNGRTAAESSNGSVPEKPAGLGK